MKNCTTMSREMYWHFNSCNVATVILYTRILEMDTNSGEEHLQGQSENVASQFCQTLASTFQLLCITTQKIKFCVSFLHKSQQYNISTCNLSNLRKYSFQIGSQHNTVFCIWFNNLVCLLFVNLFIIFIKAKLKMLTPRKRLCVACFIQTGTQLQTECNFCA